VGATAPAPPSKDGPEEASAAKSGRCCQPQAPPEAVRAEIRPRCCGDGMVLPASVSGRYDGRGDDDASSAKRGRIGVCCRHRGRAPSRLPSAIS